MNLYCEQYPADVKHDVLFIHGNLASTAWWEPTVRELNKSGANGKGRLLLADWRGCGRNPDWPAGQAFTIEDLANDYLQLLDNVSPKRAVHLVGHSLGGLIALQMMILQPKRFEKAVFLDPVGAKGVVLNDGLYEAFRQMAVDQALTRTVILGTITGAEKLDDRYAARLADDAFKAVRGIGTAVLEILKTLDLRERARQVQVPTLILHGDHDQIIPIKDSEDLARLMPQARLEKLAQAGHCWNVENPSAFAQRLKEWFT